MLSRALAACDLPSICMQASPRHVHPCPSYNNSVPWRQARLDETNAKLRDLQKAARGLTQLQRLKAAADETCTRLRTEVLGIKQQKVALARQIERSQRDFAEHRWWPCRPTAAFRTTMAGFRLSLNMQLQMPDSSCCLRGTLRLGHAADA